MTTSEGRAARDVEIRRTYADPEAAHHEAVAHAEVDRSYADSAAVAGDANSRLAPGYRLPDALEVERPVGEPRRLHELTHRPGHTVLVLGEPGAGDGEVRDLVGVLEAAHAGSPVVGAVLGLCTRTDGSPIGRIDASIADRLGVDGVTLLAVRPDRYVGFRDDGGDPEALQMYPDALTA